MRVKDQLKVMGLQQAQKLRTAQQCLKMLIEGSAAERLALGIPGASPGRHDKHLIGLLLSPHQIIKAAQAGITHNPVREPEFTFEIVIFHFCATGKKVHFQSWIAHPLHVILDDSVLQKCLYAARMHTDLAQMIEDHQVRGCRLNMAAHKVIRRQVLQIMLKRSLPDCPAELADPGIIRTVRINHIAGIGVRVLCAQIAIEPVSVVPGIIPPL